jgi:hypothetical protein
LVDPRRTWTSSWLTPTSTVRDGPSSRARTTAGVAYPIDIFPEDKCSVNLLDDVRKLKLRYTRRTPGKAELVAEYVGGRIKVFEVERFLLEQLLEQLEDREAWPTIRLDTTLRWSRTELPKSRNRRPLENSTSR